MWPLLFLATSLFGNPHDEDLLGIEVDKKIVAVDEMKAFGIKLEIEEFASDSDDELLGKGKIPERWIVTLELPESIGDYKFDRCIVQVLDRRASRIDLEEIFRGHKTTTVLKMFGGNGRSEYFTVDAKERSNGYLTVRYSGKSKKTPGMLSLVDYNIPLDFVALPRDNVRNQ